MNCLIYGLGVQLNVHLSELQALPVPSHIDVVVHIGELPQEVQARGTASACEYYISPHLDERGQPGIRVSLLPEFGYHLFSYSDGTDVLVSTEGDRVWATGPQGATIEDTATYLLGPILGFVLRLRGVTCLHASAVVIDDQAVALVGPSGFGKSSTAAAFAKLGHSVLTDDVLALSDLGGSFEVHPAYPRVRLWPEAVASMFGSDEALPRITPNWDKRFLDLAGAEARFQHSPLPLAAVYLLGERSGDPGSPRIDTLTPRDGLMKLVSDTCMTYLLDHPRRAQEFELLGRLVATVPFRQVTPSTDMSRIFELCSTIVEDCRRLSRFGEV